MAPRIALITGANGVTAVEVINALSASPSTEWSRIYAISRSQPQSLPAGDPRIQFIQTDLTAKSSDIVAVLKQAGVKGITHFYHYAYIHSQDRDYLCEVNVPMFKEVLHAVESISPDLQRVVLQTGAKHYGIHFEAPSSYPVKESDGRKKTGPRNFYYGQEDILFDQAKGKKWKWNVIRPYIINGITKGNGALHSYATTAIIYMTLQAHLNRPAVFSGSEILYKGRQHMSSSTCVAAFTLFISTAPDAADQDFNIVDGVDTSWEDIWTSLARAFGLKVEVRKEEDYWHNFAIDNRKAWEELCAQNGTDPKVWNWGTWDFNDLMMVNDWPADLSIEKARQYGWHKTYDTKSELQKLITALQTTRSIPTVSA